MVARSISRGVSIYLPAESIAPRVVRHLDANWIVPMRCSLATIAPSNKPNNQTGFAS